MKKVLLTAFLLVAGAGLVSADEVAFVDSYEKALEIAGEESSNILITFYADW